ncbi:hypothetical protein Tco_0548335 [Tanacetum coccineum]
MACSLPHTIDEIEALVEKLIDEDIVDQKAITELAMQFDNASTSKDDMRKAYEKCNDISQENHALIGTFLNQESDKNYEMHLALISYLKLHAVRREDRLFFRIRSDAVTCITSDSEMFNGGVEMVSLYMRCSTDESRCCRPSTPTSDSSGPSRNAECSNCKLLLGKIKVLVATIEMYMHALMFERLIYL